MTQMFTYSLTHSVSRDILGCGDTGIGPMRQTLRNSNSGECIWQPSFVILHLIVWKLSCWYTNRRHWKHPPCFAMLCWWAINTGESVTRL